MKRTPEAMDPAPQSPTSPAEDAPESQAYRRAGIGEVAPEPERSPRWSVQLSLVVCSVLLSSLALAPFKQFYLALFALVPYFIWVHRARSYRTLLLWGWVGGLLFFGLNLWYLWFISIPGLFAVSAYFGLYWAAMAMGIRFCGLLDSNKSPGATLGTALLLAAFVVATDWLRGSMPVFGLEWLFLGHSQSPLLTMCQVADFAGVYGVTFWVALVNVAIALLIIDRVKIARLRPTFATAAAVLIATASYGAWRLWQAPRVATPGPTVLVIQPNYPQSNDGSKGAKATEIVAFHVEKTLDALRECAARGQRVDLIVWSETMMPPLNRQARLSMADTRIGEFWESANRELGSLASTHGASLLAGGSYLADFRPESVVDPKTGQTGSYLIPADSRNSAYLYDATGILSDQRYDKVHLMPFGEFIPFKDSIPWLHRLLIACGPPDMESYFLHAGAENALTVFDLQPLNNAPDEPPAPTTEAGASPSTGPAASGAPSPPRSYRFVTPICFEDIVPSAVAKMIRTPLQAPRRFNAMFAPPVPSSPKAADFIVNITNDGWFKFNEQGQHLQAAIFRSIENRVPTARAVNTGISGFIDSSGNPTDLVPRSQEGWSAKQLMLDPRLTFYTRFGDVFATLCSLAAVSMLLWNMLGMTVGARKLEKPARASRS